MTLVFAFVFGLLLTAVPAFAQGGFAHFEGTEVLAAPVDFGTVSCPGGEPTGQWPGGPPCTPGSRPQVRGLTMLFNEVTSDPRINGIAKVVANANVDNFTAAGPGSGPEWGTIYLEVTQGGVKTGDVWEGSWTGIHSMTGTEAYECIHVVVYGSAGSVEGLKAEWDLMYTPDSPDGTFGGLIVAPAGQPAESVASVPNSSLSHRRAVGSHGVKRNGRWPW